MEDRIMSIRVKDDNTSDALIYAIHSYEVIGGSIESGRNASDYALAVLTKNAIMTAGFKNGECTGFAVNIDKNRPELNAMIVLAAGISDNNFDSISIEWEEDTAEYIFTFNKDE